MASVHRVDVSEALQSITIKVTGLKVVRARFWLAALIFRLGGLVAGCNVVVSTDEPWIERPIERANVTVNDQGYITGYVAETGSSLFFNGPVEIVGNLVVQDTILAPPDPI